MDYLSSPSYEWNCSEQENLLAAHCKAVEEEYRGELPMETGEFILKLSGEQCDEEYYRNPEDEVFKKIVQCDDEGLLLTPIYQISNYCSIFSGETHTEETIRNIDYTLQPITPSGGELQQNAQSLTDIWLNEVLEQPECSDHTLGEISPNDLNELIEFIKKDVIILKK